MAVMVSRADRDYIGAAVARSNELAVSLGPPSRRSRPRGALVRLHSHNWELHPGFSAIAHLDVVRRCAIWAR